MPLPLLKFIKYLKKDFPSYTFIKSDIFKWSPQTRAITYCPTEPHAFLLLLHELAHAELNHISFEFDIELVRLEAQAWHYAKQILGPRYAIELPEDFIQDNLDSYRIWLHKRSLCPHCTQTGVQQAKNTYSCINCRCSWLVNDARQCQLKRYAL